MNRIWRGLKNGWQALLLIIVLFPFAVWLQDRFGLPLSDILSILLLLGIGFLLWAVVIAGSHLGSIERKLDKGLSEIGAKLDKPAGKPNPGNPGEQLPERTPTEREPEQKPTGGGAFAGMIVGGALGSAGGPIGVIIGGVIGALIANQLEYENIQRRRRPPQK